MITPLFKPVGPTTHSFVSQFAKKINQKTTHTGSLDPMASGIVLALSGADRFKKEAFSDVKKTYTWDILLGISTDTHDALGIITEKSEPEISSDSINSLFAQWTHTIMPAYEQVIPSFSAKRWHGSDFSRLSKSGIEVPIIKNKVDIYEISASTCQKTSVSSVINQIQNHIKKVTGDFRQDEILDQWNNVDQEYRGKDFLLLSCQATVGKKTYIRGLTRDFGLRCSLPCVALNIVRTRNGTYGIPTITRLKQYKKNPDNQL